MPCEQKLIESNLVGLHIAEEECPGVLPDPESGTVWYEQKPNSFADFSTNLESVKSDPISADRQNQKGEIVSEDVAGGFVTDFTRDNLTRLLQGFFFANARQPASIKTQLDGTVYTLASADMGDANGGLDDSFTYASGHLDSAGFAVGDLIQKYGWADVLDNDLAVILTVGATALTCTSDTVRTNHAVASPPAAAGFEVVGIQFASADVDISFVSNVLTLVSSVYDFTANVNLFPGMWVFIGGDATTHKFANNQGYARIRTIEENALTLDCPTWTPVTEAGTGKTIRLFFGITVKNEQSANIVKRTYQLERTLGKSSAGNTQAEYLEGCIASNMQFNIPSKDKVTAELNYVGTKGTERAGLSGDLIKTGTRVPMPSREIINTSTNVFLMRIALATDASVVTPLFAYVTEGNFTIDNGANPQPAVGLLGALDITTSNFNAGGSVTAYFTTVEAKRAIRQNKDVTMNFIIGKDNYGSIIDIPRLTLDGGAIAVEKDAPITIPVEAMGHENSLGYTASYTEFRYLPDAAMPAEA